ncbi:MAG: hypothetical protein HY763_16695 [Planctomycetes bacterium]|nr:hypothetical protein [Planctomycetota bacterium]
MGGVKGRHFVQTRRGRRGAPRLGRAGLHVATLLLGLGFPPESVRAAGLKSLQSGSLTMSVGGGSAQTSNVTITSVDLSKSVLWFNYRGDSNDPDDGHVRGRLTSSTNIQFYRPNDASLTDLTIQWYVAEFACGVYVQRGLANTADTTNVTINTVDTAKSFVLTSGSESGTGTTYNNDDFFRARLTSSTNLEVSGLGSPTNEASWQVVEYDDASVQRGTGSLTGTSTSTTASITAVDLAKSIVLLSWKTDISGTGANFLRAYFSSTTQLTIDRAVDTGGTIDFAWEVVQFTDRTSVQYGLLAFDSTQTSRTATLTAVNLNTSVPLLSTAGGTWGGKHAYSADDQIGPGMFTTALTDSTTLTATRQLTGSAAADIAWFVVSFEPVYVENFQTWSATSAATWQTKSLAGSPFNVPPNAVVEIAVRSNRNVAELSGGVRAVGSSLERRLTLMESEKRADSALLCGDSLRGLRIAGALDVRHVC